MAQIRNKDGQVLFDFTGDLDQALAVRSVQDPMADPDFTGAVFDCMRLEGVHLDGLTLTGASFRDSDLYWASFFESRLDGADLTRADLRGADLKAANLRGACLREAKLGRDEVGGRTDLRKADMREAVVEGTDFTGARYDGKTRLPAGLNPRAFQMVLDEE
jgi:uncharacterized protein YjbI with pentapeptide repeats